MNGTERKKKKKTKAKNLVPNIKMMKEEKVAYFSTAAGKKKKTKKKRKLPNQKPTAKEGKNSPFLNNLGADKKKGENIRDYAKYINELTSHPGTNSVISIKSNTQTFDKSGICQISSSIVQIAASSADAVRTNITNSPCKAEKQSNVPETANDKNKTNTKKTKTADKNKGGLPHSVTVDIRTPISPKGRGVLAPGHLDFVTFDNPLSYWRSVLWDENIWHKFQVLNAAKYEEESILRAVMDVAAPATIIPVLYRRFGRHTFFLARNCASAIERLCQNNLVITEPSSKRQLTVHIQLKHKIGNEVQNYIRNIFITVVQKRFCNVTRRLDLSAFHKDSEFIGTIFCPLEYPHILHHISNMASSLLTRVVELNLSDNRLTSLSNFFKFKELTHLDLRNNQFKSMADLECLNENPHLASVWLSGNPLCTAYNSHWIYIHHVMSVAPGLKSLDGVALTAESGFILSYQNYMIIQSQSFMELVNHFLEHYFNLYDCGCRMKLFGIYNRNAIFSVTRNDILESFTDTISDLLDDYTETADIDLSEAQNEIKKVDSSTDVKYFCRGQQKILWQLRRFPGSKHDPYSFAVTVPIANESVILISVSGVFKELKTSERSEILAFSRLFLLKSLEKSEYQIINEILHVSKATEEQISMSFRYSRPPVAVPVASEEEINRIKLNRKKVFERLCEITELKHQTALKYLLESNWDLETALANFMKNYRNDKIPSFAFIESSVT